MKIVMSITDENIKEEIEQVVSEMEEDEIIVFPDSDSREEFIEDCVRSEVDKYELYDDYSDHPDYNAIVYDMAKLYEYLNEED